MVRKRLYDGVFLVLLEKQYTHFKKIQLKFKCHTFFSVL